MSPRGLILAVVLFFTHFGLATSRSISVNGQCEVEVASDRAAITLVAQFTDKQSQVASKKSAEIYEKIRAEVQKLNLKDLEMQTTESYLQELFDYSIASKRSSLGFQSSLGLRISTSEIKRIGEVIALSQKLQIHRTENLSTYLSSEKAKLTRENCLVTAVKNAKEKAQKMAQALQSQLGEPILIQEGGSTRPTPMPYFETVASDDSNARSMSKVTPTVEAKSQTLSVEVLVQFALK
jgi:uncharacterized protein YggE